jgi:hypothetical protein
MAHHRNSGCLVGRHLIATDPTKISTVSVKRQLLKKLYYCYSSTCTSTTGNREKARVAHVWIPLSGTSSLVLSLVKAYIISSFSAIEVF